MPLKNYDKVGVNIDGSFGDQLRFLVPFLFAEQIYARPFSELSDLVREGNSHTEFAKLDAVIISPDQEEELMSLGNLFALPLIIVVHELKKEEQLPSSDETTRRVEVKPNRAYALSKKVKEILDQRKGRNIKPFEPGSLEEFLIGETSDIDLKAAGGD